MPSHLRRDAPRSGPRRPPVRARNRRAAIVLETVLVLPVLLLLIFVMVQFGLFFENMQQLALASRVGAEEAAHTPDLPLTNGDPVPANILNAINKQFESSRMSYSCVTLEHNLDGNPVTLVSSACGTGGCGATNPVPPRKFVRLSISVPKRAIMPACLRPFACAGSNACDVIGWTTVFRYEVLP